nr:substrate-binding domain-containing protein [uncultured Carboxylicivirga sp.]
MKKIILLFTFMLIVFTGETLAQSYKVIVNNTNSISTISKKDISQIFLKKKTKWENGVAIVPVDLTINSTTRELFTTEVHNKKISAIRSYWQQAIFSGAATAPIEKGADKEVIEYVKNNAGAIGYISGSSDASGVKVITISN